MATDARVSQEALLALVQTTPAARVSQEALLVLISNVEPPFSRGASFRAHLGAYPAFRARLGAYPAFRARIGA